MIRTDEDIFEPPEKLAKARVDLDVPDNEFITVKHGQTSLWINGNDILSKEEM